MSWQNHGKARVRVGRRWTAGGKDYFVEWKVQTLLESSCEEAYTKGDNKGIVATDTQRNTCYYVADQMKDICSPEEYAQALANHFLETYEHISQVTVDITAKPWTRAVVEEKEHQHGFVLDNSKGERGVQVVNNRKTVTTKAKCTGLTMLKTTQSGFEGYIKDKFTLLPETKERMMASSVDAEWTYIRKPSNGYDSAYDKAVAILKKEFFGPAAKGVYSYSIQQTLYDMGTAALKADKDILKMSLYMPNIHFLPTAPLVKSKDAVYVPVDEPHGVIHAEISRE